MPGSPTSPGAFPTTIWSQVRLGPGDRRAALETLARRYQGPAEAFLRRACGLDGERARDVFQDFFVRILETDFLERADPERGRFRAFFKVALRRFATDELRRAAAVRRGGTRSEVALDAPLAATLADPAALSPEEEHDRAWRAALVNEALERTRLALLRDGRELVHAVFRDYYLAPGPEIDYAGLAARHAISTTDVSNHLMRAKRAFRGELRALVLETVSDAHELEQELRWVLEAAGP